MKKQNNPVSPMGGEKRKIVQIAVSGSMANKYSGEVKDNQTIIALCNDGTLWARTYFDLQDGKVFDWVKLNDIPQGNKSKIEFYLEQIDEDIKLLSDKKRKNELDEYDNDILIDKEKESEYLERKLYFMRGIKL